eukprot:TRINITY_DN326_c0_g1_i5.p1 TRINITY_DN326_c0_g1~~TRINITY_DN326_c0_g1_i5.p1  ORF type:complete len:284 (-),score=54.85 TRINITY_DN326_c0_g1_i5:60-827(-)
MSSFMIPFVFVVVSLLSWTDATYLCNLYNSTSSSSYGTCGSIYQVNTYCQYYWADTVSTQVKYHANIYNNRTATTWYTWIKPTGTDLTCRFVCKSANSYYGNLYSYVVNSTIYLFNSNTCDNTHYLGHDIADFQCIDGASNIPGVYHPSPATVSLTWTIDKCTWWQIFNYTGYVYSNSTCSSVGIDVFCRDIPSLMNIIEDNESDGLLRKTFDQDEENGEGFERMEEEIVDTESSKVSLAQEEVESGLQKIEAEK